MCGGRGGIEPFILVRLAEGAALIIFYETCGLLRNDTRIFAVLDGSSEFSRNETLWLL